MNSTTPTARQKFWAGKKVLVTGASGFVGANLLPLLRATGCAIISPSRRDCNLLEQEQVRRLLTEHHPDLVLHLAGVVGGVVANQTRPAELCYENLLMSTLLLHESWRAGVKKYVSLIGACSYPNTAPSPIAETELFNGMPQRQSAPYSLAKAMSVIQAEAYRRQHNFDAIVLVPGNLYGPHDNFDLNNSHVVPALIRKFLTAQEAQQPEVSAWGSGQPVRDFVYITDACEAILVGAEKYSGADIINLSSGHSVTIKELTETVAELTGYQGKVVWDVSKPDGQMFKGLDVTRMKEWLGCECRTDLRTGLKQTIDWFRSKPPGLRL